MKDTLVLPEICNADTCITQNEVRILTPSQENTAHVGIDTGDGLHFLFCTRERWEIIDAAVRAHFRN